jgi:hypothetical protein
MPTPHIVVADDSTCLAANLQRMTVSESSDQPDIQLRKANLRALLNVLTPWEVLEMRRSLKDMVPALATLTDLPPELVAIIGTHLDLVSLTRCLRVSKAWGVAWRHGVVVTDVCRHFFPGLIETSAEKGELFPLLQEASRKYVARALCKSTGFGVLWYQYPQQEPFTVNMAIHPGSKLPSLDVNSAEQGLNGANPPYRLARRAFYSHGMVAWQPDCCTTVLDHLYKRTRRACRPPGCILGASYLTLVGLSKDLLVVQENDRSMHVPSIRSALQLHVLTRKNQARLPC